MADLLTWFGLISLAIVSYVLCTAVPTILITEAHQAQQRIISRLTSSLSQANDDLIEANLSLATANAQARQADEFRQLLAQTVQQHSQQVDSLNQRITHLGSANKSLCMRATHAESEGSRALAAQEKLRTEKAKLQDTISTSARDADANERFLQNQLEHTGRLVQGQQEQLDLLQRNIAGTVHALVGSNQDLVLENRMLKESVQKLAAEAEERGLPVIEGVPVGEDEGVIVDVGMQL